MKQILLLLSIVFVTACSSSTENTDQSEEAPPPADEQMDLVSVEEDYIISENEIHDLEITPVMEEPQQTGEESDETEEVAEAELYETIEIVEYPALETHMVSLEYEPEITDVSAAIVPIRETETLISFNKKDEQKAVLQVVHDETGQVQQIMFADKKHRDSYDVQAGMTAKEAKQLRKDLKHMMHHGNHYLYNDKSNIMYLLDIQTASGDEIIEADIDTVEIQAIIWKHKHHKDRKTE